MTSTFPPITSFSVVIPVFNEAASLPSLCVRLRKACQSVGLPYELVFVDDGSDDGSLEWLVELVKSAETENIQLIELNRNYGQHAGIIAGFSYATGDAIITLDADLQNPPEELPRLLDALADAEVVGSIRRLRQDSWLRRMASKVVNRIIQRVTGQAMHDYGCMLRGYRRTVVESILACSAQHAFIPLLANQLSKRTVEITVAHEERKYGISKYSFWQLLTLWFDLISSVNRAPLRYCTLLGVVVSGVSFLSLFGLISKSLYQYGMIAWENIGFSLFAMAFGIQFIAIGVLGEYIGRIHSEVRAHPKYLIRRHIVSSSGRA